MPAFDVASMVRSGEVIRLRRGSFVLASAWNAPVRVFRPDGSAFERDPLPVDRFRLRSHAILRSRPAGDALSHHASCVVQGVAVHGVDLDRVDVASAIAKPITAAGLVRHPGADLPIDRVHGIRCVRLHHALVQVACASGSVAAVCSMDDAVHRGLVTVDQLRAVAKQLPLRYRNRVLGTIGLVDGRSESVGETRTRLMLRDLGFTVALQVWISDARGRTGRVDFVVDDVVIVEFDGLVKYEGAAGRAALAAEKQRESRLSATGREVVRVVWPELDGPAALGARIRVAKARALRRGGCVVPSSTAV